MKFVYSGNWTRIFFVEDKYIRCKYSIETSIVKRAKETRLLLINSNTKAQQAMNNNLTHFIDYLSFAIVTFDICLFVSLFQLRLHSHFLLCSFDNHTLQTYVSDIPRMTREWFEFHLISSSNISYHNSSIFLYVYNSKTTGIKLEFQQTCTTYVKVYNICRGSLSDVLYKDLRFRLYYWDLTDKLDYIIIYS